jgi:protein TonB
LLSLRSVLKVSSANGAPIHLLNLRVSPRLGRAQTTSVLIHAAGIVVLVAFAVRPPVNSKPPKMSGDPYRQLTPLSPDLLHRLLSDHPEGGSGSGGNRDPLPATTGHLPTLSSIQLVKPSLPTMPAPQLAVPPTILDPDAPATLTAVPDIGLPWMKDKSNSAGPGNGHTIGSSDGDTVGGGGQGFGGDGSSISRYQPGVTRPTCAFCPDPPYTDQARETKVQGIITLEVLVSPEGRAAQIHITKGLGAGLEERTLESVRVWRFTPAYDSAHRPVPAWVTIEVLFHLY